MLLQGVDSVLVVGMIRQQLRDVYGSRVLEILKQPNESPGIGPGPGANFRAGQVGARFGLTRVGQTVELAQKSDRQHMSGRRPQQDRGASFSRLDRFFLPEKVHAVLMNRV